MNANNTTEYASKVTELTQAVGTLLDHLWACNVCIEEGTFICGGDVEHLTYITGRALRQLLDEKREA